MSFGVGVRVTGGEGVVSLLNAINLQGAARRGLFEELGNTLIAQTQLRFVDEVGPDGIKWPQSIRARLEGGRTLSDTGALRQSITAQVLQDGVEVGTNLDYALPNQFGATATAKGKALTFKLGGKQIFVKSITIPARPFIGVNDENQQELEETVGDYVFALAQRAGGGFSRA